VVKSHWKASRSAGISITSSITCRGQSQTKATGAGASGGEGLVQTERAGAKGAAERQAGAILAQQATEAGPAQTVVSKTVVSEVAAGQAAIAVPVVLVAPVVLGDPVAPRGLVGAAGRTVAPGAQAALGVQGAQREIGGRVATGVRDESTRPGRDKVGC
jgi:hypothetical protein